MGSIPVEAVVVGGILAAVVTFFALFRRISRAGERMQARIAQRIAEAVSAEAEIVDVKSSPMQNTSRVRATVLATIRVFPPGGEPYQSVGAWEMDAARVAQLQTGKRVPVKIAKDDPHTIFPAINGATYDPASHQSWINRQGRRGA